MRSLSGAGRCALRQRLRLRQRLVLRRVRGMALTRRHGIKLCSVHEVASAGHERVELLVRLRFGVLVACSRAA